MDTPNPQVATSPPTAPRAPANPPAAVSGPVVLSWEHFDGMKNLFQGLCGEVRTMLANYQVVSGQLETAQERAAQAEMERDVAVGRVSALEVEDQATGRELDTMIYEGEELLRQLQAIPLPR